EYFAKGIDEGVKDVVKKAIAKYESLGAKVDEVSLPHSKYGIAAYYILASSEASSNLERFDGIRYGFSARQDGQTLEDLYVRTRSEGFGDE
ncbi:amidase family protein, partial [Oenococcus oeni]